MISLAHSEITRQVRNNVTECLDDNRIAGGKFIKEFEEKVAEYLGVRHAIFCSNGTMADICALLALRAKSDKKEVIVPALTFVAHTNAVLFAGLKPVFVDVNEDCQMDYTKIEEAITTDTLAIMPANLLGIRGDMEEIMKIAERYDLFVVEDNCESFGIKQAGDLATYSFFPSHTITTGEGGMITTDDDELAELARAAINHGRKGDDVLNKFHWKCLGVNAKPTNIAAAIGCAIIDSADDVIEKRRENVEEYNKKLDNDWKAFSPHCYPYWFDSEEERNNKLEKLDGAGVECRKLFSCLPTDEPIYKYLGYKKGDFPVAEELSHKGLFVPIHQGLSFQDIDYICYQLS